MGTFDVICHVLYMYFVHSMLLMKLLSCSSDAKSLCTVTSDPVNVHSSKGHPGKAMFIAFPQNYIIVFRLRASQPEVAVQ